MSRALVLIVGIALLAVVLLRLQGCERDADTRFNDVAEAAEAVRDSLRPFIEAAQVEADSAEARRERAEARADQAEARADSIRVASGEVRTRIIHVEVPAEAVPFTAPRDTLIALLTEENTELRTVVAEQDSALLEATMETGALRQANALLTQSVEVLEGALAQRPSRRWWVPKLTVGYSGIIDRQSREIRDGPGVSIGWEVRL